MCCLSQFKDTKLSAEDVAPTSEFRAFATFLLLTLRYTNVRLLHAAQWHSIMRTVLQMLQVFKSFGWGNVRTDGRTGKGPGGGDITDTRHIVRHRERGKGTDRQRALFRGLYINLMLWRVRLILSYGIPFVCSRTIYK